MDLTNKVALVTGGAQGIGKEITRELLKNGVKGVAILDIDVSEGEKTKNEFVQLYGNDRIVFLKTDITNETNFEESIRQTITIFTKLDIIVNNAGIANEHNYTLTIDINLIGTIRGTMLGFKYLGRDKDGNGGIILNIASLAGLETLVTCPIYTSTKFGVVGFVRAFKDPIYDKTGVTVMALCPGYTNTNLIKDGKKYMDQDKFDRFCELHTNITRQEANNVGIAAVHVIKKKTNSVWLIKESKLSLVSFPTTEEMLTTVINDVQKLKKESN